MFPNHLNSSLAYALQPFIQRIGRAGHKSQGDQDKGEQGLAHGKARNRAMLKLWLSPLVNGGVTFCYSAVSVQRSSPVAFFARA